MKKKIILPLIGLAFVCLCNAQSLSPSIISSSGELSKTKNIQLEWTLGEIAVKSLSTSTGMITEGFHQPLSSEEIIQNLPIQDYNFDVTISPNPVKAQLNINIASDLDQTGTIYLSNLAGQRLEQLRTSFYNQSLEWDFNALPGGMYFLSFFSEEGELLKTFKVAKAE